jgi:predicted FMN-binding regulatory protein PaiB
VTPTSRWWPGSGQAGTTTAPADRSPRAAMKQSRSFYAETAMYIPRQFALSDDETEAALGQAGFAHLVTNDSSGLMVTPLPLLYDAARHSLIGHVSRANPHWHADGQDSVAIFSGPHAYISPSFYATKAETGKVVPTWNYEVLNVYGRLVAHDDVDWVLNLVTMLTIGTSSPAPSRGRSPMRPKATRARSYARSSASNLSSRKSKARRRCRRTNPNATGRVWSQASKNPPHRTISSSPTESRLAEARTRTAADSPTHRCGTAARHRPQASAPPPTRVHSTAIAARPLRRSAPSAGG